VVHEASSAGTHTVRLKLARHLRRSTRTYPGCTACLRSRRSRIRRCNYCCIRQRSSCFRRLTSACMRISLRERANIPERTALVCTPYCARTYTILCAYVHHTAIVYTPYCARIYTILRSHVHHTVAEKVVGMYIPQAWGSSSGPARKPSPQTT
jgi:hypothetical protein